MVPGDRVKITVAPKGFGSENMTKMKMFTPAATQEQIIDFIADACIGAGSNPCPPIVIGVGLGGTSDKAAYLAKSERCCLRTVGEHNADPLYADMEQRILDKVNASGVGPQGLGGTVTALSCAIEPFRYAHRRPAVRRQHLLPRNAPRRGRDLIRPAGMQLNLLNKL